MPAAPSTAPSRSEVLTVGRWRESRRRKRRKQQNTVLGLLLTGENQAQGAEQSLSQASLEGSLEQVILKLGACHPKLTVLYIFEREAGW